MQKPIKNAIPHIKNLSQNTNLSLDKPYIKHA